jgi:hypothetical protein
MTRYSPWSVGRIGTDWLHQTRHVYRASFVHDRPLGASPMGNHCTPSWCADRLHQMRLV